MYMYMCVYIYIQFNLYSICLCLSVQGGYLSHKTCQLRSKTGTKEATCFGTFNRKRFLLCIICFYEKIPKTRQRGTKQVTAKAKGLWYKCNQHW